MYQRLTKVNQVFMFHWQNLML